MSAALEKVCREWLNDDLDDGSFADVLRRILASPETQPRLRHFLVVGRMCGDDEDTGITYHVKERHEAVALYVDEMWEMDGADTETRGLFERTGEGVFINGIYESETPIKEST